MSGRSWIFKFFEKKALGHVRFFREIRIRDQLKWFSISIALLEMERIKEKNAMFRFLTKWLINSRKGRSIQEPTR